MIAASAEPVFIMPLAVPEYCGAMSIGIAHIGPIVISAKKKPAERHAIDRYRLCVNISGTSDREREQHADRHHPAPCAPEAAGAFEKLVRDDAAERVAEHAREEHG